MVNSYEIINNGVCSELEYFTEISVELEKLGLPMDLSLVFSPAQKSLPTTKYPKIVFVTFQETHNPEDCTSNAKDVLLAFRNYYPIKLHQYSHLRPLPLGYQAGFKPVRPPKPASLRKLDYFWAGAENINRVSLKKALDQYQLKNPCGKVVWYDGWSKGFPLPEYAEYLADTKVIFAPRGWVSPESYRYFEAALSGCIIISEPKPDFWYYDQPPNLWPGSWELVPSFLDKLLSDMKVLDQIQQYTLKYWERCCKPAVVAKYIKQQILLRLKTVQH